MRLQLFMKLAIPLSVLAFIALSGDAAAHASERIITTGMGSRHVRWTHQTGRPVDPPLKRR